MDDDIVCARIRGIVFGSVLCSGSTSLASMPSSPVASGGPSGYSAEYLDALTRLTLHDMQRKHEGCSPRGRTAASRRAGSGWRPAAQTFPGLRAEVRLLREVAGLSQPLASHPPSSSRHTDRLAHEMMSRWMAASSWSPVARRRGRAKARSVVAAGRSGCSDAVCRRTHPPIGAAVQAAPGAGS